MSEKIVQFSEEVSKGQIRELARGSVEETLNELLEKEAEQLTQAARYERSEGDPTVDACSRLLPGWELCAYVGLRQAAACCRDTVGQQEVHEHETFGGFERRLTCRVISFTRAAN